ncbi:hypothetical protein GGX14DRAFT_377674, partial [Mycena pura]
MAGTPEHSRSPLAAPTGTLSGCTTLSGCRTLSNVIFRCFTAILACTWVSVHPNVPPPGQRRVWRRLSLMLIAIVAPEVIVGMAARQCIFAHRVSRDFDISVAHSFFLSMGGFVTRGGHPVVTRKQLRNNLNAIKNIPNIANKRDVLGTAIAVCYVISFVVQFAARVAQGLPMTQLESPALALVVINMVICLLWLGKPYNV